MGAVHLLPRQPQGPLGRTMEPQPRLPPLVQRNPRHCHLPLRERVPPRRAQAGDPVTSPAPETFRTPDGGRIDRGTTIEFTFNGERLTGHPGDTLASALLAAGRHHITSSSKLGRPRGISAAWAEDPCGLVQIEQPYPEPMVLATTIELYDGLVARGIPGQGRLSLDPDPARYDAVHQHVDVLVIGAGPAGLTAALNAARSGARVALVDEQSEAGGSLLSATETLDGVAADQWVAAALAELAGHA